MSAVAETGSTNADLLDGRRGRCTGSQVLATAHQTAGRGRLDRRWDAPPGANLLVSILFRDPPDRVHETDPARRARRRRRGAAHVAGVEVRLKWPNDLLVGDAKLAGVLAQAGSVAGPRSITSWSASG